VKKYVLEPIGVIRSPITDVSDAPLFYTEGAPNARLELSPGYLDGLDQMKVGDEIIVITWLHLGRRDVLKVHPRGDPSRPLTGVFSTRSPHRPNPLGLHRAKVSRSTQMACSSARSKRSTALRWLTSNLLLKSQRTFSSGDAQQRAPAFHDQMFSLSNCATQRVLRRRLGICIREAKSW
jgi:tRNA-Thr(GGU) m(6)t(6)A37 methyltransferase TsaA